MASLAYPLNIPTVAEQMWAILRKSLRDRLLDARSHWPSKRVLAASTVFCLVAFTYTLAVGLGLPAATLRIEHDPALAIGLDLLLSLSCAGLFHRARRPRELNLRVPYCPGCPRCTRRGLSQALLQAGGIAALCFGLWQPLPQLVWQVASPTVAALLWTGCGMGWLLMLRGARDPALLVAGVCLAAWCTPGMTLGHLVFAIGSTAFAAKYRQALAKLARGDETRRMLDDLFLELRS